MGQRRARGGQRRAKRHIGGYPVEIKPTLVEAVTNAAQFSKAPENERNDMGRWAERHLLFLFLRAWRGPLPLTSKERVSAACSLCLRQSLCFAYLRTSRLSSPLYEPELCGSRFVVSPARLPYAVWGRKQLHNHDTMPRCRCALLLSTCSSDRVPE